MSTPSTATATFPPYQSRYGYSNHQIYQSNATHQFNHDSILSGSSRLPPVPRESDRPEDYYSDLTLPPPRNMIKTKQLPAMTTSDSTPSASISRRDRRPDWHDFYKNGPPKEIIVIDDDSPPPAPVPGQGRVMAQYPNQGGISIGGPAEHANKKRRTGYDMAPARTDASYSNNNTPHFACSGSGTVSTDRTTSLHTTAPTSLGSHGSGGSGGTYVESSSVGQKRKRVTRQTTAEEKKRREIESVGDAFSSYIPPPKPPIKAKEVYVQPVKDVGYQLPLYMNTADVLKVLPHQHKVDDEDGHFIVVENTDLTERCK
jgi:dual-specificity kinase